MQLQFQKQDGSCLRPLICDTRHMELTQELRLTEQMPDAGRILQVVGQPILRSKQWGGGQVTVSGGVMTWVLYLAEEDSAPQSAELWVPFQMRWDIPDTESDGTISVLPRVRFSDGRILSSRKIMVRIGLSMTVDVCSFMTYEYHAPQDVPDDVHLLRRISVQGLLPNSRA